MFGCTAHCHRRHICLVLVVTRITRTCTWGPRGKFPAQSVTVASAERVRVNEIAFALSLTNYPRMTCPRTCNQSKPNLRFNSPFDEVSDSNDSGLVALSHVSRNDVAVGVPQLRRIR